MLCLGVNTDDRPHWIADEASIYCIDCLTEFDLFERRHHCRSCGKVYCDKCSSYRSVVSRYYVETETKRVCKSCYEKLNKDKNFTQFRSNDDVFWEKVKNDFDEIEEIVKQIRDQTSMSGASDYEDAASATSDNACRIELLFEKLAESYSSKDKEVFKRQLAGMKKTLGLVDDDETHFNYYLSLPPSMTTSYGSWARFSIRPPSKLPVSVHTPMLHFSQFSEKSLADLECL